MNRVGVSLLANLLLALAWVALTGDFSSWNFAAGFLMGLGILSLVGRDKGAYYVRKISQVTRFALFFHWELIKANLKIAGCVLKPTLRRGTGFLAVRLDARTDLEIVLLANLITLTPGTLSLDISPDRRFLLVHAMFLEDPEEFKRVVKEHWEKRVLELLR